MPKATGVPMNGKLERTNAVNKIPCQCNYCFHSSKQKRFINGKYKMVRVCNMYHIDKPDMKTCKRYYKSEY